MWRQTTRYYVHLTRCGFKFWNLQNQKMKKLKKKKKPPQKKDG